MDRDELVKEWSAAAAEAEQLREQLVKEVARSERAEAEVARLRDIIESIHGDVDGRGREALVVMGTGYAMKIEHADEIKRRLRALLGDTDS